LSSIWMTDSHVITKVNKIVFAATDTIHHWRTKALRGPAQRAQLCIGQARSNFTKWCWKYLIVSAFSDSH
jgi:hypothetical protein